MTERRPDRDDLPREVAEEEALLDDADDAIEDMIARERRRDQKYNTGGDDLDAEIDRDIDGNAPTYPPLRQE